MMDNFKIFKQECKLCDDIIYDDNFQVIEDVAKDIFDILLLKLTLNDTQNIMCTTCSSNLLSALNFKSKCLDADSSVIPYVDLNNPKPVDLKEIYAREKGSKQGDSMLDDQEVCRLCLQPVSGDHKSIQEMPVDSIEIYIPEINFEVTTNPVVCLNCHDALCVHSSFIKNCLDVDKCRNGDAVNDGKIFLNDHSVKMEEIDIKSEKTEEETLFETIYIKEEEHDEGDAPSESQVDLMHTEESESHYDLDDREQTTAPSTFANYQSEGCSFKITTGRPFDGHIRVSEAAVKTFKCDKCKFETKHKSNLVTHCLRHKDPSEVKMFKCNKCKFESKHKNSVTKHRQRHKDPSEVRMFACGECDYRTIDKSSLNKHELIHKAPSEVEMYKCEKCPFITKHKRSLVQHGFSHMDPAEVRVFQCDECDFKSARKDVLKRHQLRHKDPSEVRMFKCDHCDYKSMQKGHLKQHQLKHKSSLQVQMHRCDKCTFATKYKKSLKYHSLIHRDPVQL